ncbi:hypothetical protein EYS09_14985 [Streptomyces kasugaensis]|uniref:FtsK domain-containing protein n=1 Tax=Streptomyces kasugaensis TaxID=1946 RepID=A0A4Q9HUR7_STRKA|nr:hypothetical protein [Streptomyces kasugaensis]TBO58884.1 hypothetical protein EYS09_14985 [Streptomyces kasugaensis]
MTTYPPDRIVIDLGIEGEFLTDNHPGPDPAGTGDSPTTAEPDKRPGLAQRLATGTAGLARRETTALRTGARVLKAERGAWLNASEETPAHLRADLLNRRYTTWTSRRRGEAERLEEKAADLDKQASSLDRQAERLLSDAEGDAERTGKQAADLRKEAAGLRKEAAGWRAQAREAEQRPYTGHREPATADLERHRRRTARRRWASTAALGLAIGWTELHLGGALPALTATGITATAWAKGRFTSWRRELPDVPALTYEPSTGHPTPNGTAHGPQEAPRHASTATPTGPGPARGDSAPFPIRGVTACEDAEEALRRALLAQSCDIEEVTDVVREPWGWSARVIFTSGSPDELAETDTYKGLITALKLRRDGLLVETDPDHGDTCTVRMILTDPFTPELVGTVPYRAPLSLSITDLAEYGVAMDASPLTFTLAGLMLLMVADSGGGKSGVMLAMGEVATACYDTAVLNLDPAGTGIGDLEEALTLSACMDDTKICAALDFLLDWCSARARQRAAYKWGNKWRVSREHPAICVFVDEWPQLSDKAKKRLIRLLLLGRKEAIWFYAGSQYGTKDYLGEAIGQKLSAKILGACRRVDITELMGAGAVAEGYRADLIQAATHTATNDAGQIYATGLPGMPNKPMRYQVREISSAYAERVAAERRDAGLPDLTHTLTEAGLLDDWQELQKLCAQDAGDARQDPVEVPEILQTLRKIFAAESDPEMLSVNQIHTHLAATDPDRWDKWNDHEDRIRLGLVSRALLKELSTADVELESERITDGDSKITIYRLTDVEEAIDALG